jgi:hypothetical protein
VAKEFKFVPNTGSLGRRVLDPQDHNTCYGVV